MDLLDTWKRLERDKLEKPISGARRAPLSSKHAVAKLKRNYFIKTAFSFLFLIISGILLFHFEDIYIRVTMLIVTMAYIIFLVSAFSIYHKIKTDLPVDKSLKAALIHTKDMIETNLRFEERAALYVYPFACSAGFFMGLTSSGGSASRVFSETFFFVALLITIAVLTPLCYWLAHWMHKVSYGRCLSDLKKMIADLESDI